MPRGDKSSYTDKQKRQAERADGAAPGDAIRRRTSSRIRRAAAAASSAMRKSQGTR